MKVRSESMEVTVDETAISVKAPEIEVRSETERSPAAGTAGAGEDGAIYRGIITVTRFGADGEIEMFPLGPSFELSVGQVNGTEDLFIGRLHVIQIAGKTLDDLDVIREITNITAQSIPVRCDRPEDGDTLVPGE